MHVWSSWCTWCKGRAEGLLAPPLAFLLSWFPLAPSPLLHFPLSSFDPLESWDRDQKEPLHGISKDFIEGGGRWCWYAQAQDIAQVGMTKREENSLRWQCRDSGERGPVFHPGLWKELSPARQGVGPSWRARSERDFTISKDKRTFVCYNNWVGWGGERGHGFWEWEWDPKGEIRRVRERETSRWKRDTKAERVAGRKKRWKREFPQASFSFNLSVLTFREASGTAWRDCQSLSLNLGALVDRDKPCGSQ